MWVWVGPRWMRPGSRFARVMWLISLPIAVGMIIFVWSTFGLGRGSAASQAFLVIWTLGLVAIEAVNFRTLYLGRGRRAAAVQRAVEQDEAH